MDETEHEEQRFKPPYMSFGTFWNFITKDLAGKPLPPQIDRSLMQSRSGSDQANLTAALKGFVLIDEDLRVTPALDQLVKANEAARNRTLADIIRLFYPAPLEVSEGNGTEKQLHESFRDTYGIEAAETRRKAVTFFLHAARTAGITLSPHFPTTRPATANGTSPRRRSTKRKVEKDIGKVEPPVVQRPAGETKVVDFGSAGTVTITVDVKWLDLQTDTMITLRKIVDDLDALGAQDVSTNGPQDRTSATAVSEADP